MYSLYRAWFGVDEETYPRLETLSPPDTLIRVGNEGEHQFVAHRGVLAAHSGYLKALLATSASSTSSARDEPNSPIASVSVSSVGGEAFAPLLNYMYTGRLEVTPENIYSVLLATHLLHMPGALEQCRAALLRLRGAPSVLAPPSQTTPPPGTILRPVANRLVGAVGATTPLCWSQPTPLYSSPHLGLSHLANFQLSSGIPILPSPTILRETSAAPVYTLENEQERKDLPRNGGDRAKRFPESFEQESPSTRRACFQIAGRLENAETRRDTSNCRRRRCRIAALRDTPEEDSPIPEERIEAEERIGLVNTTTAVTASATVVTATASTTTVSKPLENNATSSDDTPVTVIDNSRTKNSTEGSSNDSNGVVYDVACCDGPVKFHRVLNKNYVSTSVISSLRTLDTSLSDDDHDIRTEDSGENDENGKPEDTGGTVSEVGSSAASSANYTCGYCRHTFKSHYCYRKHARRHLLPNTEGGSSGVGAEGDAATTTPNQSNRPEGRRREVKLLDLNVQYYPCKICGSKFPSYYFVHKHKKLCHANVEESVGTVVGGESSSHTARPTSESTDQ